MDDENKDRISALPDFLIHHILSYLPSTKEVVRTCLLSKRWEDQWTHVPVLIFDSTDLTAEKFFKITESVLLSCNCFKIKKLHIRYRFKDDEDPLFATKIRFATRRNVEQLILDCENEDHELPQFLFNYDSLVKLDTDNCAYEPKRIVNWKSLKELNLRSTELSNQAIEFVLSGSPLLEFLELTSLCGLDPLVIASKSLKRLEYGDPETNRVLEISCPNLEYLRIFEYYDLSNQTIEHVLSGCPLLKSFELQYCNGFDQLYIASTYMRRLFLQGLEVPVIELSCPNLDDLELKNVRTKRLNLKNVRRKSVL